MALSIDIKRLRMVIPVYSDTDEDTVRCYVHATPIEASVFEAHYLVLAKTFAALYSEGIGQLSGPQVAYYALRELAQDMGRWEPVKDPNNPNRVLKPGVRTDLMPMINRLATVICPAEKGGWDQMPFETAVKAGVLSEEEASEVQNAVVFFTVASHGHRKSPTRRLMLDIALKVWGARIESLSCAEFVRSLTTSIASENSGATAEALSLTS